MLHETKWNIETAAGTMGTRAMPIINWKDEMNNRSQGFGSYYKRTTPVPAGQLDFLTLIKNATGAPHAETM